MVRPELAIHYFGGASAALSRIPSSQSRQYESAFRVGGLNEITNR